MGRIQGRGKRALAVLGVVAIAGVTGLTVSAPAGAVDVGDEAAFRAAWTNPAETRIDLTADITLTCGGGGVAARNSATPITVDGHGFTITQTCANNRVLEQNSFDGTITFVAVTITGGDFGANGAGIHSLATVEVIDTVITGNTAGGSGGGILGFGQVNATRSTFSGNTAGDNGAAITGGSMNIVDSTFSGNNAGADGVGGAIFSFSNDPENTQLHVTNSTFSGNTAGDQGGAIQAEDLTLVYVTLAGNTSPNGANLNAANLTSFGSVVALPQGGDNCDVGDATTSNGYNFSDDDSCGFTAGTDQQGAGDPGLGELAANGGPTETRLPAAGSPLIGAIPDASCQADGASGITADQRGVARPQPDGCDIGAVEVEGAVPAPVVLEPTFTG
jgi:predicted outer membrane repeat protein